VEILNLESMTRAAGLVFAGRCIAVERVEQPQAEFSALKITFEVEKGLKGVEDGSKISFLEHFLPGAPAAKQRGPAPYRQGQSYLLFLHPSSESGLTSPVGMGQGVFLLLEMPDGSLAAKNGLNNANLDWAPLYQGSIPADALFERIIFLIENNP
jgi:hypothetical protein